MEPTRYVPHLSYMQVAVYGVTSPAGDFWTIVPMVRADEPFKITATMVTLN